MDFGFPQVASGPYRPGWQFSDRDAGSGDWKVTVLDEGPYAPGEGERERDAVKLAARACARQFGAFFHIGAMFSVEQLGMFRNVPEGQVVHRNPGDRPTAPALPPQPPELPAAPLSLDAEPPTGTDIDLGDLREVPWQELHHAHGTAIDVPDLIEALAEGFGEWDEVLEELIGDDILHQGSCYSATGPTMPFLARLITSNALPAQHRSDIYQSLIHAATRYAASLIGDAERAAARRRPLKPAEWSAAVYEAVGTCIPDLLARWEVEPEPMRVVLAVLAALYPEHGADIAESIRAMARVFPNTDVSALLDLTLTLIEQDDEQTERHVLKLADQIRRGEALGAAGVPIATRVAVILAETSWRIVGRSTARA
jgi:hypothetical protein